MSLFFPKTVKNLLKKYQIRPRKSLGQNFLIDRDALKKIVSTAEIQQNDTILEIGPGLGVLTRELALRARRVIAVEKDEKMAEILKEELKECKNLEIIAGDILKINFQFPPKENLRFPTGQAISKNYKVVANLPYYITSPVIRKFLETENQPQKIVLMVQKEVAQRICSKPPKMSLLSVSVQFYGKPEIVSCVSKKSFYPEPKVDSAILKITPFNKYKNQISPVLFFRIAKAGFSQPRKQLANNLSKGFTLTKAQAEDWILKSNVLPTQRAETLSIEDWISLAKTCQF